LSFVADDATRNQDLLTSRCPFAIGDAQRDEPRLTRRKPEKFYAETVLFMGSVKAQ
jgi:hypothetical protein